MTATITQKKMMAPTTPTPISFNGGDHHRMPRRCLHAPWRGGQIVATSILAAGSRHGSGTAPTWQPVDNSWHRPEGPLRPRGWPRAEHPVLV
jgi:hypothetical protein